jgi:DNA-binding beta-propeller fold protein YncE
MSVTASGHGTAAYAANQVPLLLAGLTPRESFALSGLVHAFPEMREVNLVLELTEALLRPDWPPVLTAGGHMMKPQGVCALPDGTLAVADRDAGRLWIVGPDDKVLAQVGENVLNGPMSAEFRRDGSVVTADLIQSAVTIFSPSSGAVVTTCPCAHVMMPKGCVELPTGDMVISSYGNGKLILWRRNDECVVVSAPGAQRPAALALSPDGTFLIVCDETARTILRYDTDGIETGELCEPTVLMANTPSEGVAFLANGTVLVSDTIRCVVHHLSAAGTHIAMYGGGQGTEPGTFDYPAGLCALPYNRFAVCDRRNGRVQVLQHSDRLQ